jgi:hypothetical protein
VEPTVSHPVRTTGRPHPDRTDRPQIVAAAALSHPRHHGRRPPFPPPRPPPLAAIKAPPVNDLFFLLRPLPPLHHRIAIVEPPCNAAPGPPSNSPSSPRALHRRRELPQPPRRRTRLLHCSTTAGSPLAASATVDSSGEPPSDPSVASNQSIGPPSCSSCRTHQPHRRAPSEFGRAAVDQRHGASSPALGFGPTSHVGWAIASREGWAPL